MNKECQVLAKYLRELRYPFRKKNIQLHYESTKTTSLSQSLQNLAEDLGIDHMILKFDKNNNLYDLPSSFVIIIPGDSGYTLGVVSRKNSSFVLFDGAKTKKYDVGELSALDIHSIVVYEEYSAEKKKATSLFGDYTGYFLIFLILVCLCSSWSNVPLLIANMIGLIVAYNIRFLDENETDSVFNRICTDQNTNLNSCTIIKKSKVNRLLRPYEIGDFCIVYFVCAILFIISGSSIVQLGPTEFFRFSLFIVPIPVILFFYQILIIRKICNLCLIIGAIVIINALKGYFTSNFLDFTNTNFILKEIGLVVFFITVFILYVYSIPSIFEISNLAKMKIENLRFKKNPMFFQAMYNNSEVFEDIPKSKHDLVLGPNNEIPVSIFISFNCRHCKTKTLELLDAYLQNKERFRLEIKFLSLPNHKSISIIEQLNMQNQAGKFDNHIMIKKFIDSVFEYEHSSNADDWKDNLIWNTNLYPAWCSQHNLNFSPIIFINGRLLRYEYNLQNLKYVFRKIQF